MDGVRARRNSGPDVLLGVEVARDLDDLVRRAGVQRAFVVRRDHGDGHDAELAARPEDAERYLSAVRHEQLLDRHAPELMGLVETLGRRIASRPRRHYGAIAPDRSAQSARRVSQRENTQDLRRSM